MTAKVVSKISISPDSALHLENNSPWKIDVNPETTVSDVIEQAKTHFSVPFPEKAVYRFYPKSYDTPLDSNEIFSNIPHV